MRSCLRNREWIAILFHFPSIIGHQQLLEVVIVLLGAHFLDLGMYGFVVGRLVHIADDTEGDGEVRSFHQSEFQLQGVVHAVGVVHQNVFLGDSVFAKLHHFQAEAFLHQAIFAVFTENHRPAVFQIDGVLGASFFVVNRVVRTVVEDDAVLEDFADGGTVMVVGCFQDFYRAGGIGGYGTCEETSACAEAQLGGKRPRAPKHSSAGWKGSSTVP